MFSNANVNIFFCFKVGSLFVCVHTPKKSKGYNLFVINFVYLTINFSFDVCHLHDPSIPIQIKYSNSKCFKVLTQWSVYLQVTVIFEG